jgi:hypothetical protein
MHAAGWLRRFERRIARFNKWFGSTAVASNTLTGDHSVDAARVTAMMGEIEQTAAARDDEQPRDSQ